MRIWSWGERSAPEEGWRVIREGVELCSREDSLSGEERRL